MLKKNINEIKDNKAKARLQKKEAKKLKKQQEKALKEENKENVYGLKKSRSLVFLRAVVWIMLIFVFIKGVIVSLRPDPTKNVNDIIKKFQTNLEEYQNTDSEVFAFAQNFIAEYMTYEKGKEEDYKNRLSFYASEDVYTSKYEFPEGSSSTCLYAGAYRQEKYENKLAVYVLANIEYKFTEVSEDNVIIEKTDRETMKFKVPLTVIDEKYIVDNFPVVISDNIKIQDFKKEDDEINAIECPKELQDSIELSVTNFFKAYYEEHQNVIDYYLAPEADHNKFLGLNGAVTLESIDKVKAYYENQEQSTDFIVMVSLSVRYKNNTVMKQNYILKTVYKDKQYYIVDSLRL